MNIPGICDNYLYKKDCDRQCGKLHLKQKAKCIDSHCHLDRLLNKHQVNHVDYDYPQHLSSVVSNFVDPPFTHLDYFLAHDHIYGTIGIHPSHAKKFSTNRNLLIHHLTSNSKILAVGECGLDSTHLYTHQESAYSEQLQIAYRLDKPIVIHCRDMEHCHDMERKAFNLAQQYLPHNHPIHRHCFTGTHDDINMWSHFTNVKYSFPNLISYTDKESKHKGPFTRTVNSSMVAKLHTDVMMAETDAPYFPVPGSDISYSTPGHVLNVALRIANLKNQSIYNIMEQLHQNTVKFYKI